jgi:hypothetical protein
VRVWYNADATSIDGAALVSEVLDTSSIHAKKFANARIGLVGLAQIDLDKI